MNTPGPETGAVALLDVTETARRLLAQIEPPIERAPEPAQPIEAVNPLDEVKAEIARIRELRATGDLAVAHSVDPIQIIKDELAEIETARAALDARQPDGTRVWIFDPRYYRLNQRETPLLQRPPRLGATAGR